MLNEENNCGYGRGNARGIWDAQGRPTAVLIQPSEVEDCTMMIMELMNVAIPAM